VGRRAAVLVAVAALGLSACGGGDGDGEDGGDGGGGEAAFNAAVDTVFNESDAEGGVVRVANNDDWDTLDPGETYYAYSWNFARLYGRSLTMFNPAPGEASSELLPDLAEDLGEATDDGRTWTYTLREGVRYEDGTPVTSADVKHAVLRSTDKETFPNGPAYWEAMLDLPAGYKGPYKTPDMNTDSAIETPDERTIVFHLKQPFAGFDYLAQMPQTMPVPQDKDTGADYRNSVLSTGPYKFSDLQPGKSFRLVRNEEWDPETDPNRNALPDEYEVTLKVNPEDIDNKILAGELDIAVQGTGVQPATLSRVLGDPEMKKRADNAASPRLWYTSIIPTVEPFDDPRCRRAVMFAMDHTAYQAAYGGPLAGGDLATTILPPMIPGHEDFDFFPAGEDGTGDLDSARTLLEKCGQPDGFSTTMAFRSDRPAEKATAEAFQESLARVGIEVSLKGFPSGDYFSQYAGLPPFVVKNGIGLATNGWAADWNDGFGFLSQIVDSRVIRETGGSSNLSVRIPEVDKMLDAAVVELDDVKREAAWGEIDKRVMREAVIYPGIYAKSVLLRSDSLTNIFVNPAYGMYDYLSLGVQQ
jgi:peptide/nickel transport system substrate-binding protein